MTRRMPRATPTTPSSAPHSCPPCGTPTHNHGAHTTAQEEVSGLKCCELSLSNWTWSFPLSCLGYNGPLLRSKMLQVSLPRFGATALLGGVRNYLGMVGRMALAFARMYPCSPRPHVECRPRSCPTASFWTTTR
jgi:hypothetical protein